MALGWRAYGIGMMAMGLVCLAFGDFDPGQPVPKSFPDRTVILGAPAKVAREVSEDNIARMHMDTMAYVHRGAMFREKLKRVG